MTEQEMLERNQLILKRIKNRVDYYRIRIKANKLLEKMRSDNLAEYVKKRPIDPFDEESW